MTIEVQDKILTFDFTPKTALLLDVEVGKWFGSAQNYVNSTVSYDFALWCALKSDDKGKKMDFPAFEDLANDIPEEQYKTLMLELTDVMGFFINIVMRNLKLSKEEKRDFREMWLSPFEKLKNSALAS